MYPTSSAYQAAIGGSHTVVSKAELWSGDVYLRDLPLSDGSVKVSAKSGARRTCSLTTFFSPGDDLIAGSGFDPLTPFGNEVRLWRGVRFADGTDEYVPLGVFVIQAVEYVHSETGVQVSISGTDRSVKVAQNAWLNPYRTNTGTSLATNLTNILQDRYPGITLAFLLDTTPNCQAQVFGAGGSNDPWKDAVELAQKAGYDLYFNRVGACVLDRLPDVDAIQPVAYYREDEANTMTSITRSDTVEETYNGVVYIVEASGVDVPLRAEAWDDNPTSPTYRYGNFGQKPYVVSQSAISTSGDADKAVKSLLSQYLGASQAVTWQALTDPALDVNDAVYVENSGTKVVQTLIVDELTVPLGHGATMTGVARTIRTGAV